MTFTELMNLLPGDEVVTIYGDTAMVIGVSQQSGFLILNIPNQTRECCQYYRDYEIKCKLCNLNNEACNGLF